MNTTLNPTAPVSRTYRRIPLAPHQMTARITPVEDLFVLAHLGVPQIDSTQWQLEICGLVEKAAKIGFDTLRSFPKTVVESFHQCAGDPMDPTSPKRRVANVRWGGVRLAELFKSVAVSRAATHLWSYGSDRGEFAGDRHEFYLKDMPIDRIQTSDAMVAYEVNGIPLPAEHGFPARLVIPGYYGTNSVKWLYRLEFSDRRPEGPFTTRFYNDPAEGVGEPRAGAQGRPVWAVPVEAVIGSPAPDAVVHSGSECQISGWAWADAGVRGVELSDDSGHSWWDAQLSPRSDHSWQAFTTRRKVPEMSSKAGAVVLKVRATSNDGLVQPLDGARNCVHSVALQVVESNFFI